MKDKFRLKIFDKYFRSFKIEQRNGKKFHVCIFLMLNHIFFVAAMIFRLTAIARMRMEMVMMFLSKFKKTDFLMLFRTNRTDIIFKKNSICSDKNYHCNKNGKYFFKKFHINYITKTMPNFQPDKLFSNKLQLLHNFIGIYNYYSIYFIVFQINNS